MGQNTQLVVFVREEKANKVNKYLASYFNRCGFAKMQLFDVIRIITTYIGPEGFKFPAQLHKAFKLEDGQFKGRATPQNVINWINKTQDNNNGGALLKLDVKGGYIEAGELYLFNDRETEGTKNVNRCVSFDEYTRFNPDYFDEDFIAYFKAFLRFYNIKIVEHKKGNLIDIS